MLEIIDELGRADLGTLDGMNRVAAPVTPKKRKRSESGAEPGDQGDQALTPTRKRLTPEERVHTARQSPLLYVAPLALLVAYDVQQEALRVQKEEEKLKKAEEKKKKEEERERKKKELEEKVLLPLSEIAVSSQVWCSWQRSLGFLRDDRKRRRSWRRPRERPNGKRRRSSKRKKRPGRTRRGRRKRRTRRRRTKRTKERRRKTS
jgi:hypothetical protein